MKKNIDLDTPAKEGVISREVKKILQANDLDFKIIKLPLVAPYGAVNLKTDLFGLYNTKIRKVISTCKAGYHISQNEDILSLVLEGIRGFGELSVEKAWSINEGKRTLIQLRVEGMSRVGSETIVRYITVVDSNDGSTSLGVGVGELVLSCQNQFYKFYKSTQSKMRHTASLEERVKELPELIRLALQESMRLTETYKSFQKTKASEELVHNFVKEVYGINKLASLAEQDKTNAKKLNNMNLLYEHIEKEMAQKGDNLFGLFSGLTSFNTHKPQKFKREEGKINALTHGENYRMNQIGLEFLEKVLVV